MLGLRLLVPTLLLGLLAAVGSAPVRAGSLGPVSVSGDQTIHVHLLNLLPGSPATPVLAEIAFLNAEGDVLATGAGSCDVVCTSFPVALEADQVTTFSVSGANLGLASNESAIIHPFVSVSGLGSAHLASTVEVFGPAAAVRTALKYDPLFFLGPGIRPREIRIGPLTLQAGEFARFTVTNPTSSTTDVSMFFRDGTGARIGDATVVTVGSLQSGSIELSGSSYRGLVRAGATYLGTRLEARLEILDAVTKVVKATLSDTGGTDTGAGMTGSGGGGGGSR